MGEDLVEREAKLGATCKFAVPDLRDLVKRTVRLPDEHLIALYFDTSDFRLWARRITLRHRYGDEGVGTWTLKLPQSDSGLTLDRTELEWPGHSDLVPEAVSAILRGIVRKAAFEPIASLETHRHRMLLEGPKHAVLAELDDDHVTIHGGPHDGDRFRQIELEAKEADDVLLARCVKRLRNAGAWIDKKGPKLARALDPDITTHPEGPSLDRKSTMADVVRASIRSGFDRIADQDYLLRLDIENPPPEAIHQARVGARRLRSDLQTFKAVLDPVWVRHTRSDLQWLGSELGLVRDADVLGYHVELNGPPNGKDAKGAAALRTRLQGDRRVGARAVASVLHSKRYMNLLDKLQAAAERPPLLHGDMRPTRRASKALPKMVKRPWKKLRKRVRQAADTPTDRQLHEIRIGAKKLRYAAEAAEPVVGKKAKGVAVAAENLQTELGDHHDAVVAEAWLRKQAQGAPSKVAFAAGQLAAEQISRQRDLRDSWETEWNTVDRRGRRWLS